MGSIAELRIREGAGVDASVKEALLDQFRCYLDSIEEPPEQEEAAGAQADLFTVFVELTALRNEVRTESRLVKEALDQFRGVFGTLQSSHATLEQELKRAQADTEERGRALLRPLLLELLDLRDRLSAGLQQPAAPPAGWFARSFSHWRGRRLADAEGWREGLGITLRRLDRILAERRVVRIETLGQRFDPRMGRVVGTTEDETIGNGIVVDEVSAGFLWDDALLRAAEVIVNRSGAERMETA
jgi:molecular chaperone GrpE